MSHMTNDQRSKVNELSKKINDLIDNGANTVEINVWRRKLNILYSEIRSNKEHK